MRDKTRAFLRAYQVFIESDRSQITYKRRRQIANRLRIFAEAVHRAANHYGRQQDAHLATLAHACKTLVKEDLSSKKRASYQAWADRIMVEILKRERI